MKHRILSIFFIFFISLSFINAQKFNCDQTSIESLKNMISKDKNTYKFLVENKKNIKKWTQERAEIAIKKLIIKYVNKEISEIEFNHDIIYCMTEIGSMTNLEKELSKEINEFENCLAKKIANQKKTKPLGIAYVLKNGDPKINSKKTRLSFVSGANYETSISESSFNLHKFQKNSKGKTILDYNFEFDVNIDAPGVLYPGDKITITIDATASGANMVGYLGCWAKIIPQGFKEWTANPEDKRNKATIFVDKRTKHTSKTWTLIVGKPTKQHYLMIYFSDGRYSWHNEYNWIRDDLK